jgi:DUF917 family protein
MGHGLPSINGKDFLPVAFVDPWGNTSITINAINYSAMERIGKMMSIASYGELAEASCFMKGNDLKESLVPYTLSECLLVGRAIKKAREECQNSSEYAAKASNGYYFGKGKITKKEAKDVDGYYQGIYNIQGMDNLKNSKFKVWFKNENHVIWENDKVVAASPDLIILLKSKDGKPISNTKLSEGEEIDIVIVPARKEFLTDKAISAFGPRYFGFDFDYKTYRE